MAFLQIDEIVESQASKYATHNAAIRKLRILSQLIVKDRDLKTPPGSPTDGDVYIPAATATGAWAGHENKIVFYSGTAWVILTPTRGWLAYISDEDVFVYYNGTIWEKALLTGIPSSSASPSMSPSRSPSESPSRSSSASPSMSPSISPSESPSPSP